MKKIILVLYLILTVFYAHITYASCKEGIELTGKNKHTYCQSNVGMTWFAAMAWCEAQSRHLATVYEVCDIERGQPINPQNCYNLQGSPGIAGVLWTNSNCSDTEAYTLFGWENRIVCKNRLTNIHANHPIRALCY